MLVLFQDAEQLDDSSDGTQGSIERLPPNGLFKWDEATEDRICDLYDHYLEVQAVLLTCC
jgi:hypothetical protein